MRNEREFHLWFRVEGHAVVVENTSSFVNFGLGALFGSQRETDTDYVLLVCGSGSRDAYLQ